jgi:protein-S-isoprenylcysteine O-methyltransferase Ste14
MHELSRDVIIGCWLAFVTYWWINARSVKRTAERQSLAGVLANRCLTLLGGVMLFWKDPPRPLDAHVIPHPAIAEGVGIVFCLVGLVWAVWSRHTLGGNWSSVASLKHGHELVERGPYGVVRHPIYSAILLMCLGTAISSGRLFSILGLVPLFVGFWIKLRQEERLMNQHFPDKYPEYSKRVKALVPFVF